MYKYFYLTLKIVKSLRNVTLRSKSSVQCFNPIIKRKKPRSNSLHSPSRITKYYQEKGKIEFKPMETRCLMRKKGFDLLKNFETRFL